jgi:hypothetical protein
MVLRGTCHNLQHLIKPRQYNKISKLKASPAKTGRTSGMQREPTKGQSETFKKCGFSVTVSNQTQGLTFFLCKICLNTIKGGQCNIQRWPSSPWCYHIVGTSPHSLHRTWQPAIGRRLIIPIPNDHICAGSKFNFRNAIWNNGTVRR